MGFRRLVLAMLLGALGGCGGTSSGYLPVDSPLVEFQPPEADDLVEEPEDEEAGNAEDSSDSEDSSGSPAAGKAGEGK